MNQLVNSMTVLLSAIIGVAILSVLVSKNAQTSQVIQAGSSGFASILGAAEAPVTGSSISGFSNTSGLDFGNGTGGW